MLDEDSASVIDKKVVEGVTEFMDKIGVTRKEYEDHLDDATKKYSNIGNVVEKQLAEAMEQILKFNKAEHEATRASIIHVRDEALGRNDTLIKQVTELIDHVTLLIERIEKKGAKN